MNSKPTSAEQTEIKLDKLEAQSYEAWLAADVSLILDRLQVHRLNLVGTKAGWLYGGFKRA